MQTVNVSIEIKIADRDSWIEEERGQTPERAGRDDGVRGCVETGFERGLEVPTDWLGGNATDALAVVRAAQCGAGGTIAAMVDAGVSFDVPAHGDEVCGYATCLITECLWGWGSMSAATGGERLLEVYAETIEALLRGGASRCVTSPVSMADSWPLVRAVYQRCGVRLMGWATREFERACWKSATVNGR